MILVKIFLRNPQRMTTPEFYGSGLWRFIHSAAGNATTHEKRVAFVKWIHVTREMFPCDVCGEHLGSTIQQYPPEQFLESAERLLKWTFIAHDAANNHWNAANRGKPRKCSPSWEEVKAMYLSVPTPPEEAPPAAAAIAAASSNRSTRIVMSHPVFQQFKQSFQNSNQRRRW